ncbi:DUF6686 family protein [Arcicella sp. LKC2W]|uniref:DUF6686 family protein n=1 Tax=Arcicella sp. LKC2W TaxID=2984198 RepID=UPI002B1F2889|nr:DUF6686 family protein [Arcicella sp. LKC2W]MEA5460910.1 DUF6686 family protein [Arcicella sp. LKC2W]
MKTQENTHTHTILVQNAESYITQCNCCNEIQLKYKNIMLVFNWSDLVGFLQRLSDVPPNEKYYVIEIVDMRSIPSLRFGFSASGIFLTFNEIEELQGLISAACERMNLGLFFRNSISDN